MNFSRTILPAALAAVLLPACGDDADHTTAATVGGTTADAGAVRYRLEDWYTLDLNGGDSFINKWALFANDAATDAVLWGPIVLYPYPQ